METIVLVNLLAAGSIMAVVLVASFFTFVRSLTLSTSTVTFEIGRRRIVVPWGELSPPRAPYFLGANFRYQVDGQVAERDPLPVNLEMAQAILNHPNCPRFHLDARIRASLRLPLAVHPS